MTLKDEIALDLQYQALAHRHRRAILGALHAQPGLYIAKLAEATEIPLSTVTHHVPILVRSGLVIREGQGYRVNTNAVCEIAGLLHELGSGETTDE